MCATLIVRITNNFSIFLYRKIPEMSQKFHVIRYILVPLSLNKPGARTGVLLNSTLQTPA